MQYLHIRSPVESRKHFKSIPSNFRFHANISVPAEIYGSENPKLESIHWKMYSIPESPALLAMNIKTILWQQYSYRVWIRNKLRKHESEKYFYNAILKQIAELLVKCQTPK